MLERLASGITDEDDTRIDWVKTPDEIVDGVEEVFSAVKDRAEDEMEILEKIWELIEKIGEAAGDVGFGEVMSLVVKGAALAAFAPFAAIGAGYLGAVEEIKKERSPIAFAEGVVMAVMSERRMDFIREKMWMDQPGDRPQFEYGGQVEQYYNNGALALGYGYGKELEGRLAPVFWADLKRDDQSITPFDGEGDWNQWRSFYIEMAGKFVKLHIPLAYG
jgi:hypothetical protein